MRTSTRRVAALTLAGMIAVAGCGGDDGDDDTRDTRDIRTTTTADDGATTTEPGDGGGSTTTATTGPGETTTQPDGTTASTAPSTAGEGQEGTGAPDEEATGVDWGLAATSYRGRDGDRIAFLCPPDGDLDNPVWGTGTYRDDSSVCAAAVHAGVINPIEGGRVVIEVGPGEASYESSEANGLTSADADAGDGSFTFPVG